MSQRLWFSLQLAHALGESLPTMPLDLIRRCISVKRESSKHNAHKEPQRHESDHSLADSGYSREIRVAAEGQLSPSGWDVLG